MHIQALQLFTTRLSDQKHFYTNTLGLPLLSETSTEFTLQTGTSTLTFVASEEVHYYHFTFNIPVGQIEQSLDWLKAKNIPIIKDDDQEIQNFESWNAKAVYFLDPDQNILEFIDRRKLEISRDAVFGIENILHLSEIGLPVDEVRATYDFLNKQTGVERYSGDLQRFAALGDEYGLFIVVDQKLKLWFPTEMPAKPAPFEMHFENKGKDFKVKYDDANHLSFF